MIREIVNVAGGALLSSFHSRETRTLTDCEINDNNNNNVETMKRKPSSKRIIGTVIIWGNDWKPIIEIKTDKFQFGFKRPLIDNNIRSRNERLFKKCSAYLFERIYKKKNPNYNRQYEIILLACATQMWQLLCFSICLNTSFLIILVPLLSQYSVKNFEGCFLVLHGNYGDWLM